jgi:hypothetical protein
MNIKRFFAVIMATTMVFGSTVTVFAEGEANGATGTGTSTGHLNTDIFTAVLPTSASIADFFNFTVDPENILATADKYTDGTTAAGADFVNDDLVYFKQASGASKAYASTSQAANVGAKNYVDVDVTVEAAIGEAATGKTIIPLVATADELSAATTPSLLLQLKVGDQTGAITSDGVTVTKTVAGQPTNFDTKYDSTSKGYKLEEKTGVTWTNNTAAITLTGKVKGGTVESTVVAPEVTLTWTVAKHAATTSISGSYVTANLYYELVLPDGVTLDSIADVSNLKVNDITLSGTAALNGGKNKIRINRSDVKTTLDSAWGSTNSFTFTFTANGVNYSAANISKD